MENEKWKDEVLNSLEGIQRAQPDPNLYAQIRAKVVAGSMQVVRRPYLALAAACLTLLVIANVQAMRQSPVHTTQSSIYVVDNANFSLYR